MSYKSVSGSIYKLGPTHWISTPGTGSVAFINPDLGSYLFNSEVGPSSFFLITGSVQITGSAPGAGTVFLLEGGPASQFTGRPVMHAQVSGGFGRIGLGKSSPKVELDISFNSCNDPNNFAPDSGGGEVIHFGTRLDTTPGALYFLNDTSSWGSASADATGSGHHQLLGIAMGTNSQDYGMLIRGWFNATTFYTGSFMPGFPVYIHSGTVGYMSAAAPTADNSYSRIVGHGSANGNLIYFNPSSNWIELTESA